VITASCGEAAVTKSPRFRDALQAKIADHFETGLATVGIIVAIVATAGALLRGDVDLTLLLVVWFQGLLLWTVRRHIRIGREHLVRSLRLMLQDRVNNQLTVLVGLTDFHTNAPAGAEQDDAEAALTAARAVSHEIESLSIESLRSWEEKYSRHLPAHLR
jgi:hypothetical protein